MLRPTPHCLSLACETSTSIAMKSSWCRRLRMTISPCGIDDVAVAVADAVVARDPRVAADHHVVAADEVDAILDRAGDVVGAHLHEVPDQSLRPDVMRLLVRPHDDVREAAIVADERATAFVTGHHLVEIHDRPVPCVGTPRPPVTRVATYSKP